MGGDGCDMNLIKMIAGVASISCEPTNSIIQNHIDIKYCSGASEELFLRLGSSLIKSLE